MKVSKVTVDFDLSTQEGIEHYNNAQKATDIVKSLNEIAAYIETLPEVLGQIILDEYTYNIETFTEVDTKKYNVKGEINHILKVNGLKQ